MENVKFNKCQTPLEDLHLENYPVEVQEQFWDFLNNVPFIRWMVSPDRPLVSELPRDNEGRAIIDITHPPILEDSDYFRPSALAYKANKGRYVLLRPNANPNSDFGKWLYSQRERGWNGYCDPKTGMWVTGDYYWMLNFCPMHLVENENGIDIRTVAHPRFWDGQFLMSHYFLQARTHGHHAAELASRGKGKAHPYSQLVYTPDGVKEWGDIQVGDVLFGDDGNLTKVTHIPFDEEEKIYTVTLSDGRKLQCTSGHLFYVKDHRKKDKMQVIDLWTIMHSDYAHKRKDGGIEYYYAIPNNKKVEFNSQRILIDPYTLGLLIGDGCLTKSCLNVAELTSGEEDFEFYKQQVPYDMYARKGKYSHGIKINNLQGKLLEYNLWNTTSNTKFIPKEYMFNSSDVRIALLQGIMDTDGTVNNNGVPMFTTTSERLAKDVRWLCHSLGYNSTMFTKQGKYTDVNGQHPCKLTYNVTILTNDPIFRLQRKLDKLIGFNSAYSKSRRDWTRIVDIKYSHREKAKCVVVDNESHCYLIGDFIVTHNTSFGGGLLAKRCIIGESENNKTEVQCMVTAVDRTKLMDTNQILRVFKDNLDHCAKYTQFASHRLKSSDQEMEWKMGFKKAGSEVEYGSKNSVSGIITGVNQDKLNGSRGVLYLIEEAGIFKNLTSMYNMIRPSVEHGSKVFGEIFAYGTAGDDQSDFTAFAEMFYSPEGYNLEPLDNVFDKEGQGRKKCCFFFPAYLNYDESCIDKNGNSDVSKALLMILYDRYKVKYGTTDINTIVKRISQYPIVPQEAMLRSHGNIFPVTELNERLNQLDNDPNVFDDVYIGELVQDNKTGEVKFNPTIDLPIRDFPTKDNKVKGALEIFEMPKKNGESKIPAGRYICSCLKEEELVNTDKGMKPVEQVTLEDKLVNIDGEFVKIKNLQTYHNINPVYKVKLHNRLNTTTFSSEHPIYCATPKVKYHNANNVRRNNLSYRYYEYDFNFRKVSELKVGDIVKAPNMYRKELPFMQYWVDNVRIDRQIENPLDKEDFWWLLGLIIGDGWANNTGYSIHISFNALEQEYIDKAKDIVENLFHRSFVTAKDEVTCKEYSFCFQSLNTFIRNNIGCGAKNKKLAEWIKYIPLRFKKQLLLGYLASDGCVYKDKIEYVSISLHLLNDMQDILTSLGITSSVTEMYVSDYNIINGKKVRNEKYKYHLRIARIGSKEIVSWNPIDLKLRKYSYPELTISHTAKRMWFSEDLKYVYIKVASIETEEYIGNVYNFECETHTFMCDWIPTHNCDPYDADCSNTMSLGSIFVMDLWTDIIVAEYTGRPTFAEDFYEICRKLCLFYNCRCMYEQNVMGMFSYFSSHNATHLLAETPEYLVQRNMISSIGYGNKSVGIRATTPIINGAFKMIQTWLRKPVVSIETDTEGNNNEVTIPNLYRIKNRALLKELVLWNPQGNFDRVMSLVQLMLYREEKMVLYHGDLRHTEEVSSGMEKDDYWDKNYPGKKNSAIAVKSYY